MSTLSQTLAAIRPVDPGLEPAVRRRLDDLTKPPGSLGRLEDLAVRYCLIQGREHPVLGRRRVCTFAGDHGIAHHGVSAYPPAVTPQMVRNLLAGGAAVNVLAAHAGVEVRVIDVGVADPLAGAPDHLVRAKVRAGTADFRHGPAMTGAEALASLEVGIAEAAAAATDGVTLLATGEMGIGNTTAASALLAALLPDDDIAALTGRGTGIDDDRHRHKIACIREALAANRERLATPLGALAALGGCEIAAIAGLILGAAARRIAVVVDGFISAAGALAAWRLCPAARDYCLLGHRSAESGHDRFVAASGERPLLDLGLRLGEGTGAVLALGIVEAAVACHLRMATFSSARVSGRDA